MKLSVFREIFKRKSSILWIGALLFTFASFVEFSPPSSIDREVSRLESVIHKRQQLLEGYAMEVMNRPADEFSFIENFPEDMVIYRYFDDTLQFWINQFPISNDDIDFFPFGYRINHLNSSVVTNTPLAYLSFAEQYVNLGSAWYVVNVYIEENQTIIAALLVQTDFPTENAILTNTINPNLSLRKQLSIVPVTFDESYIVHGKEGGVLFSVLKNLPSKSDETGVILRWIAILLAIFALFSNLARNKGVKELILVLIGLIVVRFVAVYQAKELQGELEIFSPNLYADYGLFSSLGDLLINNMLIILMVVALFMVRHSFLRFVYGKSKVIKIALALIFMVIPLSIAPYIHFSLHSLIVNSAIAMEPFKLDEITIYTLLIYFSYSLLFTALLVSLQLLRPFAPSKYRITFFSKRSIIVYVVIISLYSLAVVSYNGFQKEFSKNRVWTTKISVERDLNLELQLKGIEKFIENDPIIYSNLTISSNIDVINRYLELVHNRLTEAYFWNTLQRYDMRLVACLEDTYLIDEMKYPGGSPVNCKHYYEGEISRYGSPLGDKSKFYFLNNYNGRISYLGVFSFFRFGREYILYIELDSKFLRESIGFPDLLVDHKKIEGFTVPSGYSYGKYLNGRLVSYGGQFNYPINNDKEYDSGYQIERSDGYIHFVHKISDENLIVMSRPERTIFPYLVSFSYLILLYSLVLFLLLRPPGINLTYSYPKNSFRWKIMMLIISSLVIALLALGAGSIWFSVRYFNDNIRSQMEEKMSSVQSALSYYSKFANRYNDHQFNNLKLLEEMNRLSGTAQIDINLYRSDGLLLRTTRSEIFDRLLLGSRMDPVAFREIKYNNKKQFVNREKIGDLNYFSLYAPLFNIEGQLIAIVNIPYFSRQSDFRRDASSIIAAIINIYILLLIGAVFVGIALSNSISRPLVEISRKMQILDISEKPEHINYSNKDELGILVAAYNKMVDDLNESTQRLAQGEREQAWREMARQIAHEIKNPLTPMRLSIQHMMRLKEQNIPDWTHRFDALANSLIEQIDILSDAAGEFSSFSRFYSEELSNFDLNDLIKEQLVLFNTRDNISISLISEHREAYVSARKTQITRVLVNLISNAVQAVENQSHGRILITLQKGEESYRISVEDSGSGVPDSLTNRLFKPNFTTKSGGTGLGLAICSSIMQQSQGTIAYERSQNLGGASFVITIPSKISTFA